MTTNLHVYVGDGYSFYITCENDNTVAILQQYVQSQLNYLFQSTGSLIGLHSFMDENFNDIPQKYTIQQIFHENSPIICLLELIQLDQSTSNYKVLQISPHQDSRIFHAVAVQIPHQDRLQLIGALPPPFPHKHLISPPSKVQSQQKCQPYC